ncbi:MAG: DUF2188 domain-containing protein [Candidatus Gracilibacteria bacterium]|nr:DUF2188 domain-containing protein [Candidatus Gracilibacteria bacterium]
MSKNQHVVPYNDKWAVKKAGSDKITKSFDNQKNAIEYAKEIAKNNNSELFIHGKTGKIRERNSYGNDNFPPRG